MDADRQSRVDFGQAESRPTEPVSQPVVLFIDDLARVLRTSRSTIERRRRAGTFPIPELPGIDGRPRWSWRYDRSESGNTKR